MRKHGGDDCGKSNLFAAFAKNCFGMEDKMKTRKGYKTYPLTVAQKFHNYYAQHCPGKEVLNVGTSLTI